MDKKFGLDEFIGLTIRAARKAADLKIVDVCQMSGISQGMISKIENAQVSPSLDSLNRLCDAIGLPISQLLNKYDRPEGDAQFTKSGEGLEVVRRGTNKGHEYRLLNYQRGGTRNFELFLVIMDDLAEVFPSFSHPGEESVYVTEGSLTYRHGNHIYRLEVGDSLTFEGDVPHGPEQLHSVPVKLLSFINYSGH